MTLGPAEVRELAAALDLRPTKKLGQNFVIDANTVRRIVRAADVGGDDVVLEIGPGLGSLTLALLEVVRHVVAVEVDQRLAELLPRTIAARMPERAADLTVVLADAMEIAALPDPQPTALVANLPYNVSVPVLLNVLERFPGVEHGLVMVQAEVADRISAGPGSRTYGVPSAKVAWYADVKRAGAVGRKVFWPEPNVDSGLVAFKRHPAPADVARTDVFEVIDAAFAQRRKTLRSALAGWAGSPALAETACREAGIDPGARGEALSVVEFARIAAARPRAGSL